MIKLIQFVLHRDFSEVSFFGLPQETSMLNVWLIGFILLLLNGCGAAHQTYLTAGYQSDERTQVIRIDVMTATTKPVQAELQTSSDVLKMWGAMAQQYLNDHRDFIVVDHQVHTLKEDDNSSPKDQHALLRELAQSSCSDHIQGRLILVGQAVLDGDEARVRLWTRLIHCLKVDSAEESSIESRRLIWSAEVDHSSASKDEVLVTLRQQYTKLFGITVSDYAAPSFLALKKLLDLAPRPKLTREEDVIDKIELAQ